MCTLYFGAIFARKGFLSPLIFSGGGATARLLTISDSWKWPKPKPTPFSSLTHLLKVASPFGLQLKTGKIYLFFFHDVCNLTLLHPGWSRSAQPRTSLQLSHPKYEFWAAKNVTCLPFSLLFSGHLYKNHSAETWGLGCLFLDYSQPGYLCGLLPTDHPLRPGSHQWTHSTALSLFRWPEQLILSKMNRWVFFFESHAMLAHQTNRSRF